MRRALANGRFYSPCGIPNPAKVLLSRRQVRVGQGAVKTARARSGGIAADGSVVR